MDIEVNKTKTEVTQFAMGKNTIESIILKYLDIDIKSLKSCIFDWDFNTTTLFLRVEKEIEKE
jgi:hypothetical protein